MSSDQKELYQGMVKCQVIMLVYGLSSLI
jgi:hypothetical protein